MTLLGRAEGYSTGPRWSGGYYWHAYVGGSSRNGISKSERGAINKAQTALAEMRREVHALHRSHDAVRGAIPG